MMRMLLYRPAKKIIRCSSRISLSLDILSHYGAALRVGSSCHARARRRLLGHRVVTLGVLDMRQPLPQHPVPRAQVQHLECRLGGLAALGGAHHAQCRVSAQRHARLAVVQRVAHNLIDRKPSAQSHQPWPLNEFRDGLSQLLKAFR